MYRNTSFYSLAVPEILIYVGAPPKKQLHYAGLSFHSMFSPYNSIKLLFPCQSTKWHHLRRLCMTSEFFYESCFIYSLFFVIVYFREHHADLKVCFLLRNIIIVTIVILQTAQKDTAMQKTQVYQQSFQKRCILQLPKWMKISEKFVHCA